MAQEIERKFLIKGKPVDLQKYPHKKIIQGYVVIGDDYEVRLRKTGDEFSQPLKLAMACREWRWKSNLHVTSLINSGP